MSTGAADSGNAASGSSIIRKRWCIIIMARAVPAGDSSDHSSLTGSPGIIYKALSNISSNTAVSRFQKLSDPNISIYRNEKKPMTENNEISAETYAHGQHVFRRALLSFLVVFMIGGAFWIGYGRGQSALKEQSAEELPALSPDNAIFLNKESQDKTIDFALFWKVWGLLKDKYVDKTSLDAHALFYGAIKGMLAATGDPYTTFFDPKEHKDFSEDMSGTFDGIGAEMGIKDNILTVVAPLEGTPAEKAGLMSGDKVIKINNVDSSGFSIEEAVAKIRGPRGTDVTLNIYREKEDAPRDIVVHRDTILVKSVRFEMKDGAIAYIRVSRFGEDTEKEFQQAVRQAVDGKAKKVILDLRNNPGGYLEGAVNMGSFMIPFGTTIVIEETGDGKRNETKARGGDVLSQLPTAVLINEGSASASEILAGALHDDRNNVTLIGEKSFGKGSVQELIPIGKDTSVKITVAHWLTPSGTQINKVGIVPDIEVELTTDDIKNKRDSQLDKAIEILTK
jgi:carboxyl-terminal processing protease